MTLRIRFLKLFDALVGGPLCILLGFLASFRSISNRNSEELLVHIRRILVIRPGGIGDMILLLPVLQLLKKQFPNAQIDVVCERRNIEVLQIAKWRNGRLLIYDANPIAFILKLLRSQYDVAIDTEQFHNFSAVFTYFSGASVRIGFKINPRRNSIYTHLVNYDVGGFEGDQFMKLVKPLGITSCNIQSALNNVSYSLPPSAEAQLLTKRAFVVIHPGGNVRQKTWEPAKYAELIKHLKTKFGLVTIIAGSKTEKKYESMILKILGTETNDVISMVGKLTLSQTAELIRRSAIFIGTDSGLAHLAIATGVRSVILFGPTDENKWGQNNNLHATVRKQLPCAPCSMFGYYKPCRENACLRKIEVNDVLTAVEKVLSTSKEKEKPCTAGNAEQKI